MIAEESIPAYVEELACRGVWAPLCWCFGNDGGVEAEDTVEPFFNFIAGRISDGCLKFDFAECARFWSSLMSWLFGGRGGSDVAVVMMSAGEVFDERRTSAFAKLLDEFEGKRAPCAFISIDSGCKED